MDTGTPNTTAPGDSSGMPTANPEATTTNPDQTTETNTENMGALQAALLSMQTGNMDAQRASTARLHEVIKKEKEKEKERREKKKEQEMMKLKKDENNNNTTTTTTRWVLAGVLVPTLPVANHTTPNHQTNSTSSPIMHRKPAARDKVTEAPEARTPRDAPQGPQRRSMRIIQSAQKSEQDNLAGVPVAREEMGSATDAPVEKTVEGLSGQISLKTKAKVGMGKGKGGLIQVVINARCPVLKPKAYAGVAKTPVGGLKGRIAAKTRAKVEMEEMENQSITASTITDKATKAPRTRAPRGAPPSSQRRSLRIIESARKPVQGKLAIVPALQEEGGATMDAVFNKTVEGLGGQIVPRTKAKARTGKGKEASVQVVINAKSPILKPRAGAGVMKKTAVGGFKLRVVAKAMEQEAENQSITATTTTDKVAKTSRTKKAPHEAPQAPRRRSMRIMESQKSALDKIPVVSPVQEEGEPVVAVPVKKQTAGGLSGQIEPKTKNKVGIEKGKGGHAKTVTKVESRVTKPRAGAGVTKKGGRNGTRDGRSGKARGSNRA
ncbi:hypothetical protein C7212DRAFT_365179 [Tuber magnatum]|uniref:Uncharacterized protein n=1 Tax=Tuber magnatum TaxID=42249 RepID=A0A317SLZ6_9PEZI|nr:hypothetical protein C7212DRAFT_365179 [Tuber magnatum]